MGKATRAWQCGGGGGCGTSGTMGLAGGTKAVAAAPATLVHRSKGIYKQASEKKREEDRMEGRAHS